jgi:molybdenum cofactor synthesis domain-containing protein
MVEPLAEALRLPLAVAGGRVLREELRALLDVPGVDRAAMDGYALIAADVAGAGPDHPVALAPKGRALAGELDEASVAAGECWEIATGAPMPAGSDAVVPVESTRREGEAVLFLQAVGPGEHVSRRGEDLRAGDAIAAAGQLVSPGIAAAAASVGIAEALVGRCPRVLLVPTGDELVPLGEPLRRGQIYDSNSVALQLLVAASGGEAERASIVRDDPGALLEALRRPAFDLVVTLGGTSVGRHDLVVDVVEAAGEVLVHGIAIKPGKPVLLARLDDTPVIGLPGFPTSCLMTGYLFVEPLVRKLAGLPLDHRRRVSAVLEGTVSSPAGKRQFLTVKLNGGTATPAFRTSSTMTSISAADGWIEIAAEDTELAASTPVEVTLF